MSEFQHDNEAFRRALHAAAEQLEPAADGLQRIQARVSHRRPMPWPIAWVDVALTRLSLRVPDGVWNTWDRGALQLKGALARYLPAQARALSGRLRLGWMRPVAAMSVVAFIVAAVVYMAIDVPQALYPTGTVSSAGHGGNGAGNPTGAGSGQSMTTGGSNSSTGGSPTSGATNHTTCATKRPTITPAPSTKTSTSSPSQSTSPSPSTSTSTSTSPSPTPSTSTTGSTAPSGTGDSPNLGPAGDTGPSDSPSSTVAGERAAVITGRAAASHAKPIHHKKKPSATPSVSCSEKAGSSPTSTVSVNPDAAGALFLFTGLPGATPAEAGGRV
jgi:hypothetical protein